MIVSELQMGQGQKVQQAGTGVNENFIFVFTQIVCNWLIEWRPFLCTAVSGAIGAVKLYVKDLCCL